jgi:hypothetical protein
MNDPNVGIRELLRITTLLVDTLQAAQRPGVTSRNETDTLETFLARRRVPARPAPAPRNTEKVVHVDVPS